MLDLLTIPGPPPGNGSLRAQGRLLRLVAAGCCERDALARRLRQPPEVVGERIALGCWLGLLRPGRAGAEPGAVLLSRRGVDLVFGLGRRPQTYVDLLWDHPAIGQVLADLDPAALDAGAVGRALRARCPGADDLAVERSSAVLAEVLGPARRLRPRRRERRTHQQLRLAFPRPRAPVTGYRFKALSADLQLEDPAAYRAILQALLDEGELAVAQVAQILAGLGQPDAPAGAYADLAVRRGDARRCREGALDKLVVTAAAVERRDLSDTVATVALSDPDYRAYLEVLQATAGGDPAAAARYGRLRMRFSAWDARIFGEGLAPRAVAQAADKLIKGRGLQALPLAVPDPEPTAIFRPGTFLDQIGHRNLAVALPPSLDLLVGGLTLVNRALEQARSAEPAAALQPRVHVHGGLLHPGEAMPGSLPDRVSLRLHVVERQPWLALLVAVLLEQRLGGFRLGVRLRGDRLRVTWRRRDLGDFLTRADDLMRERGWLVCRRQRGGLSDAALVDIAEVLGVASTTAGALVLDESFFARLRQQPEDRRVYEILRPFGAWIGERLAEWAVGVDPTPAEPGS